MINKPAVPSSPKTGTDNATVTQNPNNGQNKSSLMNTWKAFQTIIIVAIVSATVFTMWTPANLFSNQLMDRMSAALQNQPEHETTEIALPTPTTTRNLKIGIIAGHWGNDSGAVCQDGLTEVEVNLRIATLVRQLLLDEGFEVDLLAEYDEKLNGYQGLALISIHNDSCDYIDTSSTGFKVSADTNTNFPEKSNRLKACITHRYQTVTHLTNHYDSITEHMSDYHAFNQNNPATPAAIIETGFLNLDRYILTEQPEIVAQGVADGILCYIYNEPVPIQEILPTEDDAE